MGSINNIILCFYPIIENLVHLDCDSGKPVESLQAEFYQQVCDFEIQLREAGCTHHEIEKASFFVVAFIDEWILTRYPSLQQAWMKNPLQQQFFQTTHAGALFFEKLQELINDLPTSIDLLELACCCLLYGFKGKFQYVDEQALSTIEQNILDKIKQVRHQQIQLQQDPQQQAKSHWIVQQGVFLISIGSLILAIWLLTEVYQMIKVGQEKRQMAAVTEVLALNTPMEGV